MYAQDNILCQFGLINLSSVHQLISQPILVHFWWELYHYGVKWVCEVMQCTASTSGDLSGRTALEQLTGETPEISEYLHFTFYDWCWYNDNAGLGETKLGRWLGVSHRVGSLMSYWVLTQKGNVISCTTILLVTNLEMQVDSTKSRLQEFDTAIIDRLNDEAHIIVEGESLNHMTGPIILSMRTPILLKNSTRWSQTTK